MTPTPDDDLSPTTIDGHRVFLTHGEDGCLNAHCAAFPLLVAWGHGREATLAHMTERLAEESSTPAPAAHEVDITHHDVGVRIVGTEVTPTERSLIVDRVLLKEQITNLERKLDALCERILGCDPDAADRASILQTRLDYIAGLVGCDSERQDLVDFIGRMVRDRTSIVTFLAAEADRFTHEGQRAFRRNDDAGCQRLRAIAGAGRTWSAQIARGDDRLGGGQ